MPKNARTAALLGGQVDWIEAPAPDAMPQIQNRGYVIYFNPQPHVWPWQFSFAEGSPWLDKRVRYAANLCVDRTGLLKLLGGSEKSFPAYGAVGYDGALRSAQVAEDWAKRGFTGIKAKIGYPTVQEDVAVVRAMRSAVGDRVSIMVMRSLTRTLNWSRRHRVSTLSCMVATGSAARVRSAAGACVRRPTAATTGRM